MVATKITGFKSAYERAGLWSRIAFSWPQPLIDKGWQNLVLEANDARFLMPNDTDADALASDFESVYSRLKSKHQGKRKQPNLTTLTLLRLYWPQLVLHSFWVLTEIAVRLLSPLALRQFLSWMTASQSSPETAPVWLGWCWAIAVAAGGIGMTLIHHQFFWVGMLMGFTMRQQVVAAIHAKVLRLNSAAVAHANSGTIINLASNDVRRFDEGFSFWLFCWAGPLEAGMVLLMVSLELGFVPAIAGMAAMLAVIPLQAALARTVARLRRNTAAQTDERVRLTGEVIQGCLAMKMLGWEEPFTKTISGIRKREVSFAGRMVQIRGLNLTLQFCMTPIVAFVTFSVYRAMHGTLYLPSVFYALSLLNLPKLYLVYFAVIGFQYMTETYIAVQRIDKFLSMPEPPPPVHMRAKSSATAAAQSTNATQAGRQSSSGLNTGSRPAQGEGAGTRADSGVVLCDYPDGYVELGGADYDWSTNVEEMAAQDVSSHPRHKQSQTQQQIPQPPSRPQTASAHHPNNQPHTNAITMDRQVSAATSGGGRSSIDAAVAALGHKTLMGVKLVVQPGELVGVVGEVGAGKSSLLAALLGELMPMRGPDGHVTGGPVVVSRVAYCSQVPWIMAATLRDNILFQAPMDSERYNDVISACALSQDLSELPAGDLTELGERGVNLSGGYLLDILS
eukprot:GHUV01014868.1.p1 GENE.GHUV01014868.1~~GHUV01014868.1.p1  ORF type:complete len:677 (+),score=122.01 GHUV01014868.1:181-2211(+)